MVQIDGAVLLRSPDIIRLDGIFRVSGGQDGFGVLVARDKVDRHAEQVDELQKSVVIPVRTADIAGDADRVVILGADHGADGALVRSVFVAVQIADVQDAEFFQILGQRRDGDGKLIHRHAAIINEIQANSHGDDQKK